MPQVGYKMLYRFIVSLHLQFLLYGKMQLQQNTNSYGPILSIWDPPNNA